MKKCYSFFFGALMGLSTLQLGAQTRYLDEVFSDVTVSQNVLYGQNVTVLPALQGQPPVMQPLIADIYEPTGDTLSERPMFLYLHTGNFLPRLVNQTLVGSHRDSSAVEICTRLAKRGYVVASIDYRVGWNPLASTQTERTKLLLQAVYRALQDGRTAVRFFRADADGPNMYKINPSKIGVIGEGSGGYVAYAMASVSHLEEIQLDKFIDFTNPQMPIPFVNTAVMGDIEGLGAGIPIDTNGLMSNNPNHPGYSSHISFCVNMGGAMGDSSWLDPGDAPMVAFHCPNDPFAPYTTGTVVVPTTGGNVVEVSGSYPVIAKANAIGNQPSAWDSFTDVYTMAANSNNDGHEGLYPFVTPTPQAQPWQWWDSSENPQLDSTGQLTNPGMSAQKGKLYIDTIMGYMLPRALDALVNTDFVPVPLSVKNNQGITTKVFPNPTSDNFTVSASEMIQSVKLFDHKGSLILSKNGLATDQYELSRGVLPMGVYYLNVQTKAGITTHKVILQ